MNLKHIEATHILQHDQSDCGVACLLSIIKFYKGDCSLEKLRQLSGTTQQGTTLLGLYQVANQLGFNAEGFQANVMTLVENQNPSIIHVTLENQLQHYLVCYHYDNKKGFLVGDPAKGIYYLSPSKLNEIWVSKKCLTFDPTDKFEKSITSKNKKRKWFIDLIKQDDKLLWISVLLGIFVACLGMAMSIFSQKLIDDILPSHKITKLVSGIGLLTILLLARVGISVLREYFLLQQTKDFNNRINNQFFSSLLHLPQTFFDTRKIGELVARLNDTQRIQSVIKLLTSSLVIDVLVSIISLVFLFGYSWKVGLVSLLSLPIYFYIIYRSNKKIIQSQTEVMQSYAFNEGNYINTIQGISTIKNDNKQEVFKNLNQTVFGIFQEKIFNLGKINIRLSWQSGLASVFFLIGVLIYTSIQVFNKEIKLGELMAILGIVGSLLPSIANLALISIPINEAKIAFNRMYEFASMDKEPEEGITISEIQRITVQDLSFRFAGRSELFKNINLNIERGKLVAIVGESGCGKSTLGQILQRFYPFEKGSIKVNDQYELNDIELKSFRSLIGVIPQEITLFNGTIIDNILLGDTVTPETLIDFITQYGFSDYFNQLPQGLGTIVGEEGINLSGGQKQIIALARVLYKQPQFLILDEATSAMDRNTEKFSMELLEKIKPNCAIFFISHRLNTLKSIADEIYVLEDKTITYHGNHEQLLQTTNFYSEYWKE
jgi:ABC-type bacteriocin/lantibiotic exporter with double-glycine peptidase domain